MQEKPAFILCIENNAIREQALLLIESIRASTGQHRDADIFAVAPRPNLGVDKETRAALEALDVIYHEAPLNRDCPEYGSATVFMRPHGRLRTVPPPPSLCSIAIPCFSTSLSY